MAPGLCSEGFLLSFVERKSDTKAFRKEKKFTCKEVARKTDFRSIGLSEKKHNTYISKGEKPIDLLRLPSL